MAVLGFVGISWAARIYRGQGFFGPDAPRALGRRPLPQITASPSGMAVSDLGSYQVTLKIPPVTHPKDNIVNSSL